MRKLIVSAAVIGCAIGVVPTLADAAPGDLDPDFGTGGVVTGGLLDEFGRVTVDQSGRTVVVGRQSDHIAIVRYLANGTPDPSFSSDGRVELPIAAVSAEYVDVRVLAGGSIVAVGQRRTDSSDPFSNALWSAKVSDGGVPDSGYSGDGVSVLEQGYTAYFETGSVAADGSAVVSEIAIGGGFLTPIDATGVFDDSFVLDFDATGLPSGCVLQPFGHRPVGSARSGADTAVHVVDAVLGDAGGCPGDSALIVTKQNLTTGDVVWSHPILPPEQVADQRQGILALAGSDVLVATTDGGTTSYVNRLTSDGVPVAGWGTGGRATLAAGFGVIGGMTALPDGTVAVVNDPMFGGIQTLRVDRLLSNGSPDSVFGHYTAAAGGDLVRTALASAPDGDIAVTTQRNGQGTVRHVQTAVPAAVPLEPGRLLDTRPGETTVDGQFAGIGRASAGSVTKVHIAGRGGIPDDASAALVNLTIVGPSGPGYATLYPCTPTPPTASNVNYGPGAVVANSATAKLDGNGDVCIFTLAASDILLDSTGYVPAGSGIGTVTPARLLDTRPGESTIDGQFAGIGRAGAGSITKVRIAGRGDIPASASAAVVNLTLVAPGAPGYATIYPCTPTVPTASNINYGPGVVVANSVTAKLDVNGDVCVFTLAAADILIDAVAYAEGGSGVGTLTPARLLDTRPGEQTVDGQFAGIGRAAANSVTKVHVAGRGGVPDDATAVIANLTVVGPAAPGYATIYPCTVTPPTASNVNYGAGAVVANGVTAKLDANGDVCVFTLAATDILIDANGYLTT